MSQLSPMCSLSNFCCPHQNLLHSKKLSLTKLTTRIHAFWPYLKLHNRCFWHFRQFVLHIAVNTNVSEGFVVTAIQSTYVEGRPADRFVLDIAVNTSLQIHSVQQLVTTFFPNTSSSWRFFFFITRCIWEIFQLPCLLP